MTNVRCGARVLTAIEKIYIPKHLNRNMIKGALLGITAAIFLTSLIFVLSSTTGILKPNIITGTTIYPMELASYSAVTLVISAIIGVALVVWIVKSRE